MGHIQDEGLQDDWLVSCAFYPIYESSLIASQMNRKKKKKKSKLEKKGEVTNSVIVHFLIILFDDVFLVLYQATFLWILILQLRSLFSIELLPFVIPMAREEADNCINDFTLVVLYFCTHLYNKCCQQTACK